MTLSLYIARRFLQTFLIIFAGFFALLYLVDMIEQVRRSGSDNYSVATAAKLSLLHTPGSVYGILPLIMVLAAIALFLRLARSSELVATRAAGRSALRTLLAPVTAALAIGAIAVAVMNPLVAATSKRYETLSAQLSGGSTANASFGSDGLWLRQGDAHGQWVIHADRANPEGTALFGVSFIAFGPTGGPLSRIEAASAELTQGAWIATDAKEWLFAETTNPEALSKRHERLTLTTNLTADQIRDSFGEPATVSIWDLPGFIANLDRAGFSSRKHVVWLQRELAMPLLLAAMVLVGAGFTMRHARLGHSGVLALMALLSGLAIFFVRNFAQVLGESGQIPVVLAAWSPPLAAVLLSVSLLLHLEDG
ncbi:MAG: LPS export ABC transporter permease LptG [Albidovulum sp.]